MIVRQNSRSDRILWHFRLSWWQRRQYHLFFYFLPKRILCALKRGHEWKEAWPSIDDGPLHLPPRERYWRMLGLHQQCERCAKMKEIPFTPEDEANFIEKYIIEAEEEWADPEFRAEQIERFGP